MINCSANKLRASFRHALMKLPLIVILLFGLSSEVFLQTIHAGEKKECCLIDFAVQFGHIETVNSLSSSGDYLASGSEDKTIKIWSIKHRYELATLRGHTDEVTSVAFSPDGEALVSASEDGLIKIWDWRRGKEKMTLDDHDGKVTSVAFNPAGNFFASAGGRDDSIIIWDSVTGEKIHTLTGHKGPVTSVKFSPDGRSVASGSRDKTIRVWDTETGRVLQILRGHTDKVLAIAFHPNKQNLVSIDRDKNLLFWDLKSSKNIRREYADSNDLAFSPQGRYLATTEQVYLLSGDIKTSKLVPIFQRVSLLADISKLPSGLNSSAEIQSLWA